MTRHSTACLPSRLAAGLIALALLGGCATTGVPAAAGSAPAPWSGTVQSIQEGAATGGWQGIVGSLSGSVLGAVLGAGIGGGVGTTIATVITSSLGAAGGQEVGARLGAKPVYQVMVRGQDGIDRTLRSSEKPAYQPGATVSVAADGTITPK